MRYEEINDLCNRTSDTIIITIPTELNQFAINEIFDLLRQPFIDNSIICYRTEIYAYTSLCVYSGTITKDRGKK